MSNIISFDGKVASDDDSLVMSNGGTDVFINILALSGAVIARTESEKRLMVYLSEKDQIVGRGCVGFDIVEMPWDKETFEEDKKFIIKVVNGARNRIDWEQLDYSPNEEIVLRYLDTFENLINRMTVNDIREDSLNDWLSESEADAPVYCDFPRCEKHNTFLTCFGCQICNS
ncbi:MAG: hypothetical protein K2J04_08830 [Lachnospiraceae bacterium]|nr:hypothetical protein [Lachnospiraceae bacterium]